MDRGDRQFGRHRAQLPTSARWAMSNALWVFAVTTAQQFLDKLAKYDLTPVVDQITCATLACEAENDQFFQGQPEMLYAALRCPKTLLKFTAAGGAEEHCHEGALTLFHQRMFDWLDDTLASCLSEERSLSYELQRADSPDTSAASSKLTCATRKRKRDSRQQKYVGVQRKTESYR
jgi:hypothetical protein